MAVYVDPPGSAPGQIGRVVFTCHLLADSLDELTGFAEEIGLKPSWLQGTEMGRVPHFDLTEGKRRQALAAGAVDADRTTAVKVMRKWRGGT